LLAGTVPVGWGVSAALAERFTTPSPLRSVGDRATLSRGRGPESCEDRARASNAAAIRSAASAIRSIGSRVTTQS
jgi:hypothetical protein